MDVKILGIIFTIFLILIVIGLMVKIINLLYNICYIFMNLIALLWRYWIIQFIPIFYLWIQFTRDASTQVQDISFIICIIVYIAAMIVIRKNLPKLRNKILRIPVVKKWYYRRVYMILKKYNHPFTEKYKEIQYRKN